MKHIIKNDYNIKKEELTKEVTRIKVLLINNNNEILLGYSHNCYQFIGGHLEEDESLIDCLNREVLEEVGIELNLTEKEPFLLLEHYCHDVPQEEVIKNCKIYYFVVNTELKPNLEKTNYTKEEKEGNFEYRYVKLDQFVETITSNFEKYEEAQIIGIEMINAYNVWMNEDKMDF